MRCLGFVVAALAAAAAASPAALPDPGELAYALDADQWDAYQDAWLANQYLKRNVDATAATRANSGCALRVNGDLGQPQPVYLRGEQFVEAAGTTGQVLLHEGEELLIACTGSGRTIVHPNLVAANQEARVSCVRDNLVSGAGWLSADSEFLGLTCSSNSQYLARATDQRCYGDNLLVEIGFEVSGVWRPLLWSCFDQSRLEVLYVRYEQKPQNGEHQTGVTRPGWLVGGMYPGVTGGINLHYTQAQQIATIAQLVGQELAEKYISVNRVYLARGHLAAKTDYVFATGQRATFFFVNAAPQWQPFNNGNWDWLEQNARARVAAAGYNTTVYTGTFGVGVVRDADDNHHELYLYTDANNNKQLPVPRYFYKVFYEPSLRRGTAFIGINDIFASEEEVRSWTFCTDRCRDNPDFAWLRWQPDRIDIGYSFCCEVDDFRRTVPHLPPFQCESRARCAHADTMIRLTVVILALVAAAAALPAEMPNPGELVFVLNEDDWDDYLDAWLANEQLKSGANSTSRNGARNGCTFRVNGDLGQPQPVYLRGGRYMAADGNSGQIRLSSGEQVTIACTGSGRTIQHPNLATSGLQIATATCASDDLVTGSWLSGNGAFGGLTCSAHSYHDAIGTTSRCYNDNLLIQVGFIVDGWMYPLYVSCFDQNRLEVLYVVYEQTPANAVHQTGVDRPSWLVGSFFPGVGVNTAYTQVQQKISIANVVGEELADKYVTTTQFLARGHLAAKSDYVFATGQRATFWFVNAAPQWQPFNAGNWNWLEQNARARIGVAGYNTIIYTGTWGVTQLRDANGVLQDIYLHRDANNNPQLPVPLYFYKVIYDESRRLGTAFVSINNPWYTEEEVRALTFCTDRCRTDAFSWIGWQPDRIDLGYSFCCDVDEFRRTVPHLPAFTVDGLLS
ncbi:uncharacterized protein LOC134666891 [Cydia fagiglandana]|uniref:uncharacterized protein LOC134666891 n=1 Tax=Cydia fagiglandana TaxID=1458189 RepID=UPI002FEE4270